MRRCIPDQRSRPVAYSVSLCPARGRGFDNRSFSVHKVLKSQAGSSNWRSHSTPGDLAPQCKNGRTIRESVTPCVPTDMSESHSEQMVVSALFCKMALPVLVFSRLKAFRVLIDGFPVYKQGEW